MLVQLFPQIIKDLIPYFGIISVAGIIYWLRFFYFNTASLKPFGYSVYRDQNSNDIFLYKHSQIKPFHLQLLSDHVSEAGNCMQGIKHATYLSKQLNSNVRVMFTTAKIN